MALLWDADPHPRGALRQSPGLVPLWDPQTEPCPVPPPLLGAAVGPGQLCPGSCRSGKGTAATDSSEEEEYEEEDDDEGDSENDSEQEISEEEEEEEGLVCCALWVRLVGWAAAGRMIGLVRRGGGGFLGVWGRSPGVWKPLRCGRRAPAASFFVVAEGDAPKKQQGKGRQPPSDVGEGRTVFIR